MPAKFKEGSHKTNMNFTLPLWRELRKLSERTGTPKGVIVRRALDTYLKRATDSSSRRLSGSKGIGLLVF